MPRRRRAGLRRLPQAFEAIDLGERVRWAVYGPCIEGNVSVESGSGILVWPSWEAWAEVYRACREEILASLRAPEVPASELLYQTIQAGRDLKAVLVELKQEQEVHDPRLTLARRGT